MTTPSSKASVLPKQFIRRVMIIVGIKAIIITVFMLHFFQQTLQKTPEVCFQEKCFQVEIADTPEKREL